MPKGRPREFDVDVALDRALRVFWEKGYEGATLPDLTSAMGINRPSLYAAFGNKESLFRKALDSYSSKRGALLHAALEAPTFREVLEQLLRATADALVDPRTPRGCLLVQGALSCGDTAVAIRQELSSRRAAEELVLRRRFEQAVAEGDLPSDANPTELARFVATLMQGMAVQAAGGASRAQLRKVCEMALRAWPVAPSG